jgi:exopolysaccharide production protein ExoZ
VAHERNVGNAMDNIRSLTALRAVAASTVVYFHIMSPTGHAFGEFGVDIFFVISGFVIAMVVNIKGQSPAPFLASRIARIVPLYWILTILVLVIAIAHPNLLNSSTGGLSDFLMSLFFIPYKKANGLIHPLLFVGWTLNYEMAFYLIASLALFAKKNKTIIISSLVFVVVALCRISGDSSTAVVFFSSERMLEFVMGMCAWEIFRRGLRVSPLLAAATIAALYGMMAAFELNHNTFSPLIRNGIPSFAIVILATSLEPWLSNGWFTRLITFVGEASYATYLSHPYVVEGFRRVLPIISHGMAITSPAGTALTVIFALMVGSVLYICVDKPMHAAARRSSVRLLPRRTPAEATASLGVVD